MLGAAAAILPRKERGGLGHAVLRRSRWPPRGFREPRVPGHAEGSVPTEVSTLPCIVRGWCRGGDAAGRCVPTPPPPLPCHRHLPRKHHRVLFRAWGPWSLGEGTPGDPSLFGVGAGGGSCTPAEGWVLCDPQPPAGDCPQVMQSHLLGGNTGGCVGKPPSPGDGLLFSLNGGKKSQQD